MWAPLLCHNGYSCQSEEKDSALRCSSPISSKFTDVWIGLGSKDEYGARFADFEAALQLTCCTRMLPSITACFLYSTPNSRKRCSTTPVLSACKFSISHVLTPKRSRRSGQMQKRAPHSVYDGDMSQEAKVETPPTLTSAFTLCDETSAASHHTYKSNLGMSV